VTGSMSGALAGIKVLDAATVLAGPVAATILGDFGAEVVKIEDPEGGDFTRAGGRSPGWLQEGRNKKSVTLNLRTEAGQRLLHALVPHFDVVITNFRPPTLERYRMLPEDLQPLNPRMVVLYLTGFGLDGPYRDRGAFDRVASAYSGLTYVSGEPGSAPVRSGYAVIDYMSAYMAAYAVMAALYHREVTSGAGQVIDLALYEAGLRASEDAVPVFGLEKKVRERTGNRNPSIVPASDFETADGRRLSVHAGTDRLFLRLAEAMSMPELAADPRFAGRTARIGNQEELYRIVSSWVAGRTAAEAAAVLSAAGIPVSPVMNVADLMNDPHCAARGSVVTVRDPEFGDVPMIAPLPRMSATPGAVRWPGAALGAHTVEVLGEILGMTAADIDTLRRDGVL
jgi:crotonobetainyl-CoA:carnitine CoA-transferase CaiB-like acyl-CoA transferase